MHPEVHDLVGPAHALSVRFTECLATAHHVGIDLELFLVGAVDAAGGRVVEVVGCLLYHLIVHDLVVGRVGVHLNLAYVGTLVAAAPHTWLLRPLEKCLVCDIWLGALVVFHGPEAGRIALVKIL